MQTEMIPLVLPLAFLAVCALAGEVLIGTRKATERATEGGEISTKFAERQ